jgi:DNA-binding transcriptional regulator YdaS (Cro superfamily)
LKAKAFVRDLRKKFRNEYEIGGDRAIANRLGISAQTITNWAASEKELSPFQITNVFLKAQEKAVRDGQYHAIKPIVEFFQIDWAESRGGAKYEILPQPKNCSSIQSGVRAELKSKSGIYVFYDSRGKALYVGKAKDQSLWAEMNHAYNRDRGEVQSIKLVTHPSRNQGFKPAYELPRQPVDTLLRLDELAKYFSAYWVVDGMIEEIEALIVRSFANDLLNKRMERFAHFK